MTTDPKLEFELPELSYTYDECVQIWFTNPFDGEKHQLCMFMWPGHPLGTDHVVEKWYETWAKQFIESQQSQAQLLKAQGKIESLRIENEINRNAAQNGSNRIAVLNERCVDFEEIKGKHLGFVKSLQAQLAERDAMIEQLESSIERAKELTMQGQHPCNRIFDILHNSITALNQWRKKQGAE